MQNIINRVTYIIYWLFLEQIKQSLDIKVCIYFVINSSITYINLIFDNLNIFLQYLCSNYI
jgi:hypothetical protein